MMENPIKMDDLEVPLFLETPKCQGTSSCIKKKVHLMRQSHGKTLDILDGNFPPTAGRGLVFPVGENRA